MHIRRFDRRDATNSVFPKLLWLLLLVLTILKINLYQKFVSVMLNRSEQNIKYKFISTLHVQMKYISLKLHDRRCALIYFRKSNGYLHQSSCSISISVPCVRENNCKKCKNRKTGLNYRNFSRFNKLLSLASTKLAKARLRSFAQLNLTVYFLTKRKENISE